MRSVAKFRELAATIGFANACLFVASRLVNTVFRGRARIVKYYFTAQSIVSAEPTNARGNGRFTLSWADAACPLFSQVERPPSVLAARFAQGARCLIASTAQAELAGFLWFVIGPYVEDEVRVRFVPKPEGATAWDFDVSIMPRYRMGRLFSYLWSRTNAELAARGVRHTVSRVSAFNPASMAAHGRLGAKIVGEALFLCAGRLQLMRSSIAPKWHVSWREDQRPVVVIEARAPDPAADSDGGPSLVRVLRRD